MCTNKVALAEIARLAATARYVSSVCTGSLILGAAGLLKGRRAACHWAWRDTLPLFGATPDAARIVRHDHIFTGGGVTGGIDFALTLAAEIAGEDVARASNWPWNTPPRRPSIAAAPRLPRRRSAR